MLCAACRPGSCEPARESFDGLERFDVARPSRPRLRRRSLRFRAEGRGLLALSVVFLSAKSSATEVLRAWSLGVVLFSVAARA